MYTCVLLKGLLPRATRHGQRLLFGRCGTLLFLLLCLVGGVTRPAASQGVLSGRVRGRGRGSGMCGALLFSLLWLVGGVTRPAASQGVLWGIVRGRSSAAAILPRPLEELVRKRSFHRDPGIWLHEELADVSVKRIRCLVEAHEVRLHVELGQHVRRVADVTVLKYNNLCSACRKDYTVN